MEIQVNRNARHQLVDINTNEILRMGSTAERCYLQTNKSVLGKQMFLYLFVTVAPSHTHRPFQ